MHSVLMCQRFMSVVLYSTLRGSSADPLPIGGLTIFSLDERRKWVWSIVIVILCKSACLHHIPMSPVELTMNNDIATTGQHLATTAIAAGFLKFCYSTWLLSRKEKLTLILREKENRTTASPPTNKDSSILPSVPARSVATPAANTQDGRGLYFTQVVSFKSVNQASP